MSDDYFQSPDFSRVGIIDEDDVMSAKEKIDDLLNYVKADLKTRGIPDPARPSSEPVPLADTDVTLLTNNEVAGLYTQYVAFTAYIGDELAQTEGLEECTKKLLKDTLAKLKEAQHVKGLKGAEATAAAMVDPLFQDLSMEHMKLFFIKAVLKRRYDGFVAQAAALSRCIELRKLDAEHNRRENNFGYAGKKASPKGFGSKP